MALRREPYFGRSHPLCLGAVDKQHYLGSGTFEIGIRFGLNAELLSFSDSEVGFQFKSDADFRLMDGGASYKSDADILVMDVGTHSKSDVNIHPAKVGVRLESDAEIHLAEVVVRLQQDADIRLVDVGVQFCERLSVEREHAVENPLAVHRVNVSTVRCTTIK